MTEDELKRLFGEVSRALPNGADSKAEERLRKAYRGQQRQRGRMREYLLKIAASVAVVVAVYFLILKTRPGPREAVANSRPERHSEFVVLPYGQSDVPLEHPVIVRVQVPASELSGMGVSLPFRTGERVEADLLVGQDGIARAVRVNKAFR